MYTWRHNNILKYIYDKLDKTKFKVYSDLEGCQTENGSAIPSHIAVTSLKPDVVILDKSTVNIFELTIPFETNIHSRHTYKVNKYAHYLTDITALTPYLEAFEIGSRGTITPDNKTRLYKLYNFTVKNITFKQFTKAISEIAITSSYYIYIHRKDSSWTNPGPFSPHS